MARDSIRLSGESKLGWARAHMPVHAALAVELKKTEALKGLTVAVCSHLEAKTGVLIETIAAVGAKVYFTPSVQATAQKDVALALTGRPGIEGFFATNPTKRNVSRARDELLQRQPNLILDDGAELSTYLLERTSSVPANLVGICEQTTTGVCRLRALEQKGGLPLPVYAVNDTMMKRDLDNVHGTGESAIANLLNTTNQLLAGKRVVVIGFGYCGTGLARKARALGAKVSVAEVDPRKAVRAHLEGFDVAPLRVAVSAADFVIAATGATHVLQADHFRGMADGVVVCNVGHSSQELNLSELERLSTEIRQVRPGIREYLIERGRRINVIADGELINLAAPHAMGHPIEIIDLTLAMQLLAAVHMVKNRDSLPSRVLDVPLEIGEQLAEIKLQTLGVAIDSRSDSA